MAAPFLQLEALSTLTADQQEQAVTWQAHLQERLRPSAKWSHTIVYFRPSTGYVTDRLVFYPASGKLLIYWSLSSTSNDGYRTGNEYEFCALWRYWVFQLQFLN